MAANKETRVIKSNTLEEWRKLSNKVSLHLGDTDQLNNSLSDKTYNFVNPSSGTTIFTNVDNDSKLIRFEVGPEATLDNTSGVIILVGSPTVPASFVSGVSLFQGASSSPSFSGTIVSVSNKKILLKNSSGVFSSTANINVAADSIAAANVTRIIIESYPVGIVRVYKNSIEIAQSLLDVNGFHVSNHVGSVTLTSSPSISSFTEGSTVYHGTTQTTQSGVESNAGFWGTVLECTSTSLKLKTITGTFSSGSIVRLLGSSDTIPAANHGAITLHDNSYGHTIELNSPTNGTDDIQIFSMDIVAALNEIQDDVGITENLTTAASNLVVAINEHDAELGTITSAAMGTVASTVSTAIKEHEDQIGNESIASIDSGANTITGALNQLHTEVGSLSLSSGLGTDLTTAVNNLNADLVTAGSLTPLNTTAKYVVGAINEHESDIGNMALTGLAATNISAALREIRVDTGDLGASGTNLLTTATDLTLGINELHTELYTSGASFTGLSSVNFQDAVEELRVELGNHTSLGTNTTTSAVLAINELEGVIRGANVNYTLNTTSANLRDAINELESDLFNAEGASKRTLSSLQTSDKTSIVDSVNELHTNLYTSGVSFTGLIADDFKGAINELRVDTGDVTAANMGTTASNLTGAVSELEVEIDELNTFTDIGTVLNTAASTLADAINEHETQIGNNILTGLVATNISAGIRELRVDTGDVTAANMGTIATNLTGAISEHETQINTLNARVEPSQAFHTDYVSTTVMDGLNELMTDIGDVTAANMGTTASNLTDAVSELEVEIDSLNTFTDIGTTLTTTAVTLADAINEHETDIGNMTFTGLDALNISAALRELRTDIGDVTAANMGTTAANLTAAMLELETEIDTLNARVEPTQPFHANFGALTVMDGLNELMTDIGNVTAANLGTTATTVVTAIKEHETQIGNNTLTGLDATNISAGIRELRTDIGDVTAVNMGTTASNLTGAVKELVDEKVDLTSTTQQVITSRLQLKGDLLFTENGTNANRMTFETGTILDLTNASVLLPGTGSTGVFPVSFLQVNGDVDIQGYSVDRLHVTHIVDTSDVRIQWNESYAELAGKAGRAWQLVGLNDSEISNTADIVTFYNAKDLISSNTESGIAVTWDSTNQNFDFNVNDPIISFTGDVHGSGTLTNLGNLSIGLTIQPNSVALTTDTTGDYIRTLTGTTNQITVTGTGTEGRAATLSIPTDFRAPGTVKILGTTASSSSTTGALTVAGGVGIGKDLYVAGDLYVNGSTVELNTATLTVEDTLVLAGNNLSSEPATGGFGLEVGPITSPTGLAAGVTGAHSIVYNYANSRWEADGSLILSSATLDSPTIETNSFGAGTNLDFKNGSGIAVVTALSGTDIDVTITNSDKGSSQNIWKTITANTGSTLANINADTLNLLGGTAITSFIVGDTVTFNHSNYGTAGTYGGDTATNGLVVSSLTVNAQGHVTAGTSYDLDNRYDNYGSWAAWLNGVLQDSITAGERVGFDEGLGIDITYDTNDYTITNTDKGSSQNIWKTIVSNSGSTIANSNVDTLNLLGGTAIASSIVGDTVTFNHSNYGTAGTYGGTGANGIVVASLTVNAQGHVTAGTSYDLDNIYMRGFSVIDGDGTSIGISGNTADTLTFAEGVGSGATIDINHTDILGPGYVTTFNVTNTDKGSSQNIWKTITANTGSTSASINNDTLNLLGGTAITSSIVGDTVTFTHDNNGTAGTYGGAGSNGIVVASLTVNAQGHVTAGTSYDLDNIYTRVNDNYVSWTIQDGDTTAYTITSGDTLQIASGGGIVSNFTADDVLTISHADTSTFGGYTSTGDSTPTTMSFVRDISLGVDTYGHVTSGGVTQGTFTLGDGVTTVTAAVGSGITLGGDTNWSANQTAASTFSVSHADTSTALSVDNSGNTFIQDLVFDTFGHVTGHTSATVSIGNGTQTISAGTDLTTGGSFTANQSGNSTVTINHGAIGRSNSTTVQSPGHGSTFTVVDSITSSATGHITAVNTKTITLPADNNTLPNNGTLTLATSTGVSGSATFTADQAGASTFTVTNTDRGSSQFIFKTVTPSSGTSATADTNIDVLNLTQGGGITTVGSGDNIITISHGDTSSAASVDNSGNTFIQDLTFDTYGHVTAYGSATIVVDLATTYATDSVTITNSAGTNAGITEASGTQAGVMTVVHHNKLDGIATGAQANVATNLSYTTAASTGTVTCSTGTNATLPAATTSLAGLLTGTDKTKLNGIATGAQANVATNLSYTTAATTGTVTSSTGTNATLPAATTALAGLLTGTDKTKLDGIATGAQANVATNLSYTTAASTGTVNSSTGTNATLPAATTSLAGLLTGADKTKLNGIATSAEVNQNAYSNIQSQNGAVNGTLHAADSKTDTFTLSGGAGLSVTDSADRMQFNLSSSQIDVVTKFGRSTTGGMNIDASSTTSDGIKFILGGGSVIEFLMTTGGDFHADGDVIAYSTTTASDAKLKTNIKTVENALDKVCQLDGVTFEWIRDGKESAGVIAQNVETVLPRAVKEVQDLNGDDTHKVVDYNQLSALFIEAIKELKDENKELRAMIEELKSINT